MTTPKSWTGTLFDSFSDQQDFDTELHTFDVVIFKTLIIDHSICPFFPNIREAVRKGLGFIAVGASEFRWRRHAGTAINDILPVRMQLGGPTPVAVKLTETGMYHPITEYAAAIEMCFGKVCHLLSASIPSLTRCQSTVWSTSK